MKILPYFRAKRNCWDLIKKHYPFYEDKARPFGAFLDKYLSSSSILIDVGCGNGKGTPFSYRDKTRISLGIDISWDLKENATVHYKVMGDAYKLPLYDNSVEIVVCQELIEHLHSPQDLFFEVWRVLKDRGIFVLMTPNLCCWRVMVSKMTPYWFHKLMNKQLYGVEEHDVFPTYYRVNTPSKIDRHLRNVGLRRLERAFYEPSPATLTFSLLTTYLEILYTKFVRKFKFLAALGGIIMASYIKQTEL